MFKDTITYEDFDGNVREETVYFNLSRMEAIDLFVSHDNDYKGYLESIVETGNSKLIVDTFADFVKKAYGVKSEDGTRFVKNDELTEAFVQSAVYDEIMMKLVTSEQYIHAFVEGVVPKGVDLAGAANA